MENSNFWPRLRGWVESGCHESELEKIIQAVCLYCKTRFVDLAELIGAPEKASICLSQLIETAEGSFEAYRTFHWNLLHLGELSLINLSDKLGIDTSSKLNLLREEMKSFFNNIIIPQIDFNLCSVEERFWFKYLDFEVSNKVTKVAFRSNIEIGTVGKLRADLESTQTELFREFHRQNSANSIGKDKLTSLNALDLLQEVVLLQKKLIASTKKEESILEAMLKNRCIKRSDVLHRSLVHGLRREITDFRNLIPTLEFKIEAASFLAQQLLSLLRIATVCLCNTVGIDCEELPAWSIGSSRSVSFNLRYQQLNLGILHVLVGEKPGNAERAHCYEMCSIGETNEAAVLIDSTATDGLISESLFLSHAHEMGHVLHQFFGANKLRMIGGGTHVPDDILEVPAYLLEDVVRSSTYGTLLKKELEKAGFKVIHGMRTNSEALYHLRNSAAALLEYEVYATEDPIHPLKRSEQILREYDIDVLTPLDLLIPAIFLSQRPNSFCAYSLGRVVQKCLNIGEMSGDSIKEIMITHIVPFMRKGAQGDLEWVSEDFK